MLKTRGYVCLMRPLFLFWQCLESWVFSGLRLSRRDVWCCANLLIRANYISGRSGLGGRKTQRRRHCVSFEDFHNNRLEEMKVMLGHLTKRQSKACATRSEE